MKSLRVSPVLAGLLLLCAAPMLSAQATKVGCKDGSQPKIGHFTCWGHGGVVAVPMKKARRAEKAPAASKQVTKAKARKLRRAEPKAPAKRVKAKASAK